MFGITFILNLIDPKYFTSGNPVYEIFSTGEPDDWKSGLDGLDKSAYGVILDEQQHLSFEEETFDITPTRRMDGFKIATMWKGWELFLNFFCITFLMKLSSPTQLFGTTY